MSPRVRRLPGVSTFTCTASRSSKAAVVEHKLRGGIGVVAGCFRMLSASDPSNASAPLHPRARSESCCVVIVFHGKPVRVLWSTCCKSPHCCSPAPQVIYLDRMGHAKPANAAYR